MKKLISQFLAVMLAVCLCATVITACEPTGETYTVTYVAGEGTGTSPTVERYAEGKTFTVKGSDIFTRDGYVFAGWSDGTDVVEAGSTYTMPAKNVVFTAQWATQMQKGLEGKWSGCELDGKEFLGIDGVTFSVTATVKRDGDNGVYVVLSLTGSLNNSGEDPDGNNGQENQGDNNEGNSGQGEQDEGENNNPEDNMNPDNNDSPEDNTNPANPNPNPDIEMGEGERIAEGESDQETKSSVTMSAAMWFAKDEEGNFSAESNSVSYADGKLTISIGFGSAQLKTLEFGDWAQLVGPPLVSGTYSAAAENGDIYKVTFGENPEYVIKRNREQSGNTQDGNNGDVANPDEGNNGGDITNPGTGNDEVLPGEGNNDDGTLSGGNETGDQDTDNNGLGGANNDLYDFDNDNYNQNGVDIPRTLEEDGDYQIGVDGNGQTENDDQTDGNDQAGGNQLGDNQNENQIEDGQSGEEQVGDNIESFDIDKIVSVGEYWVVFVKEPIYDNNGPTNQTRSISALVISAGENGALIANTGEGERLTFTKAEQVNA